MSFAAPLIEDLKKQGLKIGVEAFYGESIDNIYRCGNSVPEGVKDGIKCHSVLVRVAQESTIPMTRAMIYSIDSDLSVDVFRMTRGGEEAITNYIKDLGYKEVLFNGRDF